MEKHLHCPEISLSAGTKNRLVQSANKKGDPPQIAAMIPAFSRQNQRPDSIISTAAIVSAARRCLIGTAFAFPTEPFVWRAGPGAPL
jgi:hypothetical protein